MHLHVTVESNHSLHGLLVLGVVINEVRQYLLRFQLFPPALVENCEHPHKFDTHGNVLTCHSKEELCPTITLQLACCVEKLLN